MNRQKMKICSLFTFLSYSRPNIIFSIFSTHHPSKVNSYSSSEVNRIHNRTLIFYINANLPYLWARKIEVTQKAKWPGTLLLLCSFVF